MERVSLLKTTALAVGLLAGPVFLTAQPKPGSKPPPAEAKPGAAPETDGAVPEFKKKELTKTSLSIEETIDYVLNNNLELMQAKYSILMSDSDFRKSQKKYAWTLFGNTTYSYSETPDVASNQLFQGQDSTTTSGEAGIEKKWSTGTALRVAMSHSNTSLTPAPADPTIPIDFAATDTYNSSVNITVSQELLKNFFGATDRKLDKQLKNISEIQKYQLLQQLNGVVIQAVFDYWNLTTAEKNLETSQTALENAVFIRNVMLRKNRSGLAETFEVNQANATLAQAESSVEARKQELLEARLKILNTMNLPANSKIKGVTELETKLPPEMQLDTAIKEAMDQRWDMRIIRKDIENARLEKEISESNALPSVMLEGGLTGKGQGTSSAGDTIGDAAGFAYKDYHVGVRVTYPLWDEEVKTRLRDAELRSRSAKAALENAKLTISSEVEKNLRNIQARYNMLQKAVENEEQSQAQYVNLSREFRKGRFNVDLVIQANNAMVSSRFNTVGARINYNAALLQFELSKNTLLSKYGVDVEKYLKQVQMKIDNEN